MDDEEFNRLKIIAEGNNYSLVDLQDALKKMIDALSKMMEPVVESMSIINEDLESLTTERTPAEIKRDIKHEKNPMRLKQLQKELNSSYVYWRKRNGWKDGTTKSRRSD